MNTTVSFEIAKLLKENGFNEPCHYYYTEQGGLCHNQAQSTKGTYINPNDIKLDRNNYQNLCSAPTIAEVVMWLYEKHGIWIHSAPENNEEDVVKWAFTIQTIDTEVRFVRRFSDFNSPTEAYEAAIKYTLINLIK